MVIRKYRDTDEQGWLRCRVVSFLDCTYWNDVKTEKEKYDNPSISLVAEDEGQIVGLIDIELESDQLTYTDKGKGAMIWHIGVLPEYRRDGVATKLWDIAKAELRANDVKYCELWTQEDQASNAFYKRIGFVNDKSQTWIRCYAKGDACKELLKTEEIGQIYAPEELIFDAPLARREELERLCYRINEVRLFARKL
jgi:ribosomal protein S18 acetylase RimI-like enzyme